MRQRLGLYLMIGVVSVPLMAAAQVIPVGSEFQVNTYTTGSQSTPQVCRAPDGRFVVVYESGHDHDGDGDAVFAQRYASDGSPAGTEFQVNTYTRDDQNQPQVCCDAQGDFVVTWKSYKQDGDNGGVFAQRFASNGAFRGTEFQVNTYTIGNNEDPAICCDAAGDFSIVWQSLGKDKSGEGVFGQRFASDGDALGTEFQVNTYTSLDQNNPTICCDVTGNFVVAWDSFRQDGSREGVFGQRFTNNGAPRGVEFQINTYTSLEQENPAICCSTDGAFTVVWRSADEDGSRFGVFGQRFTSAGLQRGQEFQVNTYTSGEQREPSICCGPDGGFVVAWDSYSEDGFSDGIFARHFNAGGGAMPEIQVNTYTSGAQQEPAVACDAKGNFVVVWESDREDGDEGGVFGQRFEILGVVTTPVMSAIGLAVLVMALVGGGAAMLRKRDKGVL